MRLENGFSYFINNFNCYKHMILGSFVAGGTLSLLIDKFQKHIEMINGYGYYTVFSILLILLYVFVVFDLLSGITASKAKDRKKNIESRLLVKSVSKFIGITIYYFMGAVVLITIDNSVITVTIIYGPLMLSLLREYISIGENIEVLIGYKPYMFTIIDKVFNIAENKYFETLRNKVIEEDKTEDEDYEQN